MVGVPGARPGTVGRGAMLQALDATAAIYNNTSPSGHMPIRPDVIPDEAGLGRKMVPASRGRLAYSA